VSVPCHRPSRTVAFWMLSSNLPVYHCPQQHIGAKASYADLPSHSRQSLASLNSETTARTVCDFRRCCLFVHTHLGPRHDRSRFGVTTLERASRTAMQQPSPNLTGLAKTFQKAIARLMLDLGLRLRVTRNT